MVDRKIIPISLFSMGFLHCVSQFYTQNLGPKRLLYHIVGQINFVYALFYLSHYHYPTIPVLHRYLQWGITCPLRISVMFLLFHISCFRFWLLITYLHEIIICLLYRGENLCWRVRFILCFLCTFPFLTECFLFYDQGFILEWHMKFLLEYFFILSCLFASTYIFYPSDSKNTFYTIFDIYFIFLPVLFLD